MARLWTISGHISKVMDTSTFSANQKLNQSHMTRYWPMRSRVTAPVTIPGLSLEVGAYCISSHWKANYWYIFKITVIKPRTNVGIFIKSNNWHCYQEQKPKWQSLQFNDCHVKNSMIVWFFVICLLGMLAFYILQTCMETMCRLNIFLEITGVLAMMV